MFDRPYDPELLKSIFEQTQVLRRPLRGIIAGYHVLPYVLVSPQEEQVHRSIEIRGKIRVSPRLVIAPGQHGQTYGQLFQESELMDRTLVARVFSFLYSSRHQVSLEHDDLKISRSDRDAQAQAHRVLDDLLRREIIDTGVILCPRARFYPVSIDRFITEILDEEFR